jgi:hypothetical protein
MRYTDVKEPFYSSCNGNDLEDKMPVMPTFLSPKSSVLTSN